VLIERSMLGDPKILFIDEPAAGIDIAGEQTFYDLILHLHREHGCTVVMVSHELDVVANFAHTVLCLNRMSFFGDGIAHAALAVLFGAAVFLLERKTTIPSDALISVLFTGGLALGVILISLRKGYQPKLLSFLFGSILSVAPQDLAIILAFFAAILVLMLILRRQFTLLALDRDTAWLYGVHPDALDVLFYILFSVTIVLGVGLLGVVLVSALLIIPPTIARILEPSFRTLILTGVLAFLLTTAVRAAFSTNR
jgi:zinc transport system permease protein